MAENKKKLKLKVSVGKSGLILLAVFAVLLTVDLVLKFCEEKYNWQFVVIPGLIEVEAGVHNYGAAFGSLEGARIFFIVLSVVMLVAMTAAFLFIPKRFVVLKVAIVMIAAGAVGNLVDRIAFGYVRDFVKVWMIFVMPSCNFADFWIVLGAILGVIDLLFLNEWAIFPLTKAAKAAQSKQKQEEEATAPDQPQEDGGVEDAQNSDNPVDDGEEK
ncbi:MAG: signal peptidase II [Candidatus Coproplasma sp.]